MGRAVLVDVITIRYSACGCLHYRASVHMVHCCLGHCCSVQDDDDEEEDNAGSRKRSKGAMFIDDIAAVDDEEEEEEADVSSHASRQHQVCCVQLVRTPPVFSGMHADSSHTP